MILSWFKVPLPPSLAAISDYLPNEPPKQIEKVIYFPRPPPKAKQLVATGGALSNPKSESHAEGSLTVSASASASVSSSYSANVADANDARKKNVTEPMNCACSASIANINSQRKIKWSPKVIDAFQEPQGLSTMSQRSRELEAQTRRLFEMRQAVS